MADSTLDSELFVLEDHWPGHAPNEYGPIPEGGFLGKTHHDVATPQYRVGEKIKVRNHASGAGSAGDNGDSVLIYLLYEGTGAPTAAAKQIVVPDSATLWYQVTNDPDSCLVATGSLLAAVCISTMTDACWGWFWCGGVCPEEYIPALAGNFATDDNVAAGAIGTHDLDADAIGLGPLANQEQMIGFSLSDDA